MPICKFTWLLLFIWVLASSACSVDVVAETSPVDQGGSTQVITSTSVPIVSTTETAITVVTSVVTTTVATLDLSPAWIEAQEMLRRLYTTESSNVEGLLAEHLADSRFYDKYIRENTNNILSSPMGALCWIYQELRRTHELYLSRIYADEHAEEILGLLGVVNENYNSQGSLDFLLDYLTGNIIIDNDDNNGPVGVVDETNSVMSDLGNSIENDEWTDKDFLNAYRNPEMIELLRTIQEGAGDGTEWIPAVRSVMRPEVRAAIRVGKGLSPDVQLYADALFKAVQDYIDSDQTEPSSFYEDLSGFHDFVEAAKYSPDCKRLSIALDEIWGML